MESLKIRDTDVMDNFLYSICIQGYHLQNCQAYLNISEKELLEAGQNKVVSTSAAEVLEEWFRNNQNVSREVESRLVFK